MRLFLTFLSVFTLSFSYGLRAQEELAAETKVDPTQDIYQQTQPSIIKKKVEAEPAETQIIDTLPALFSALATANKYHSYRSLLTYEANGFLTTFELAHRVNEGHVTERLLFMDGLKRQVMRKQQTSICANGETRWGLWPTALSENAFSYYSLKAVGIERAANREAIVFDVFPRDEWRYGYRYSVDRQTGIILKVITYYKKTIIERLQTVSIEYVKGDESIPTVDDDLSAGYVWRVPEIDSCHFENYESAWKVGWLPDGFVNAGNRLTAQGEQVLIFTDGLVSVSVFIVDDTAKEITKATARHGATVVVITPIGSGGNTNAAVVGEIPILAARKIAASVAVKTP